MMTDDNKMRSNKLVQKMNAKQDKAENQNDNHSNVWKTRISTISDSRGKQGKNNEPGRRQLLRAGTWSTELI